MGMQLLEYPEHHKLLDDVYRMHHCTRSLSRCRRILPATSQAKPRTIFWLFEVHYANLPASIIQEHLVAVEDLRSVEPVEILQLKPP